MFKRFGKLGVMIAALAVAALSFAQTAPTAFTATSLDGVGAIVGGLIAAGVGITIALVTYRLGKRAANRV